MRDALRHARSAGRGIGLAVVLLLGSSVASAQQPPQEQPAPAASPAPPRTWGFSVRFQETWDDNVGFEAAGPQAMLASRVTAELRHGRRGPRGELSFVGSGTGAFYHEDSALNNFGYDTSLTALRNLSPRWIIRGGGGASGGYAQQITALTGGGLLLPLIRTRAEYGTAGLSVQPWARTRAMADVRYERVNFSSRAGDEPLVGGSRLLATSAITPQISSRDSLVFTYEYAQSDSEGDTAGSHAFTGGWTRVVSPRVTLSAAGGATRFELLGTSTSGWALRASAGLAAHLRRSTLDVRYERGVTPAFGFGRDRLSDVVTASWVVNPTRKLRLMNSGTFGATRDPSDPTFSFNTGTYAADLGYTLGRRFAIVASYSLRTFQPETTPSVTGQAVSLSLGFDKDWP